MKIGTQNVVAGTTYHCDKCEFNLAIVGLPQTLIVADHFGAHLTGNKKIMRNTMEVSGR